MNLFNKIVTKNEKLKFIIKYQIMLEILKG
jgi:hypothetical protein